MKYASDKGGMLTSVHDWKPLPTDQFAPLLHLFCHACCDPHGHEGLHMTSVMLDREACATIYYAPKQGWAPDGVRSPVLMTVSMSNGKVICFEHMRHSAAIREKLLAAGRLTPTARYHPA